MTFDVAAGAYGMYMGRYAEPLADAFVRLVGPRPGQQALDVGCGPGAMTDRLVQVLGAESVTAIDPSASFVDAVGERCPGVDVRRGVAQELPFADDAFDLAIAQLVVHFMPDPVAGLREMARVTRSGGVVAASVWDNGGGRGPLATFWRAARDVHTDVPDETGLPGTREGHLAELFQAAGLQDIEASAVEVSSSYASFEEWWGPFSLGVGSAGDYVARLDPDARGALEDRCRELLPDGPFDVKVAAWVALGRAEAAPPAPS